MSEDQISRRQFLKRAVIGTGALVFGASVVLGAEQVVERGKDAVATASEAEKKYQNLKAFRPNNIDMEEYKTPLGEFLEVAANKEKLQPDIKKITLHVTTTDSQGRQAVYQIIPDKNNNPVLIKYFEGNTKAAEAISQGRIPQDSVVTYEEFKNLLTQKIEMFDLTMNYVDRVINPQKQIGNVGPDPFLNFYKHTGKPLQVAHNEQLRVTPNSEVMSIAIAETYNFIDANVPKVKSGRSLIIYQHVQDFDKFQGSMEWRSGRNQVRYMPDPTNMGEGVDQFGGVIIDDINPERQQLHNNLAAIFHKPIK